MKENNLLVQEQWRVIDQSVSAYFQVPYSHLARMIRCVPLWSG